ncbi:MAG: hypothetical protein Q9226_004411 [Calogaya cf. arnoldii]
MASQPSPGNSKLTRLPNGTTYDSVLMEPKQDKAYLLFLHGFPNSSYDWRHQISFFADLGYGVVAPDLLGYGGTDKPSQLEPYKLKPMSNDIIGLLDYHGIKEVIGVGHDCYKPPYDNFDVDVINNLTQRQYGYPIFGYWHFFNTPEAADIMTSRYIESSTTIMFPANTDIWLEYLCPPGGIRDYYEKGITGPLPDWILESEMETYKQIFSPDNGGYRGGLNRYKAQMANLNFVDEKAVPFDRRHTDKPSLLVVCTKDYVGIPSMQEESTRAFANDLVVENLDCGHWVQLEKAKEVSEILKSFIEERLLKA